MKTIRKILLIITTLGCLECTLLSASLENIDNFTEFVTKVPWEQMSKNNDIKKMQKYFNSDFFNSFLKKYQKIKLLKCELSTKAKSIEYTIGNNIDSEKIIIPVMKHEVFPFIRICWFKTLINPLAKTGNSRKCLETIKQLVAFLSNFTSLDNKDAFICALSIRKLNGMQNETRNFLLKYPKLFSEEQIKEFKNNIFLTRKFYNKYNLKISPQAIKLQHTAVDSLNAVLLNYPTASGASSDKLEVNP